MAAMVLASSLFSLWTASFWYVQKTDIQGSSSYTRAFLNQFLQDHQVDHRHILTLNPIALKAEAQTNPLVQDIQIERQLLPTKLILKVQERKAAYLVYQQPPNYAPQTSKHFVIDLEGVVLPLPPESVSAQGVQTSIDPKLVQEHFPLEQLELLRHLDRLYQQKEISIRGIYDLSAPENLILYQKDPDLTIWLGRPEDLPIKLQLIEPTLKASDQKIEKIDHIDLRFWKHPVVKTR